NDPWDVYAPGAIKHPARAIFRGWFTENLREQCRRAAAAAYVTERTLQTRYPCSGYSAGVSDVELPRGAFVSRPRTERKQGGPHRLVTVGSLEQMYKATDVLIRALAKVRGTGLDVTLDIVGDGRLRPKFERLAADLGLRAQVTFQGQVPGGAAVRRH